jgi:predicted Rossmann fold flavoprotein
VKPEIIVIGGGAAGIMAAVRAAQSGAQVTLLEKNMRLGMKILISGGGKCNLTHSGSMEGIRAKFRANEARFLKPSFYKFTNTDFLQILSARGMGSAARTDGRVFPIEPANAKDVVGLLTRLVEDAGVQTCYGMSVTGLAVKEQKIVGVEIGKKILPAASVIIAVGGSSYPSTGTTGDGWKWLSALGHPLVPLRAALAPIYLETCEPAWSGIALREVTLRARSAPGAKEFVRWSGDLLFTHKGISGPTVLGISREVAERMPHMPPILEVDLVPQQTFEELQEALRTAIQKNPRETAARLIEHLLPSRLILPFLAAAQVESILRGAHLPAKALNRLISTLKGWPLGRVRHVPLERGEVVAGGIGLEEVDPQTMHSRLIEGLFLCGEILDIAGPVGGYNLQAAWSTGWVAGENAAKDR